MKIGQLKLDNKLILAPMAGITDLPYRLIMKHFGAGLVFTEMVSANGMIREGRKTRELLRSDPGERPLGVQLFGDAPQALAEAARLVEGDGDLIDLNLGCPVPKVVRSGAGSALLREPAKVRQIIAAVRRVTDRPFTIKIRSGWDQESINFLETGRIAEGEGVDAITLHPRTRSQGFSGEADWDQIRRLKEALSIPVIGSGDLFTAVDAVRMLQTTGCDAVMIGRGGYGNPWLFCEIDALLKGRRQSPPAAVEVLKIALWHLDLQLEHFGPRKTLLDMRKHLCWYSRGLPGAAAFRTEINHLQSLSEMRDKLTEFFAAAASPEVAP